MSQHPAYLPALVTEAGIRPDSIRYVEPLNTGVTNRTSLVVLLDDTRYILREYAWPYASGDNLHRVEKECYLHHLLQKHDVPVPAMLAQLDDDGARAVLMEYKPGHLLGDVVGSLSGMQCDQAWRSVGAALRKVHSIRLPDSCPGIIVGERVQPFVGGSWGDFHYHESVRHAINLLKRDLEISYDLASMKRVLKQAIPVLNERPLVLLHNDPHPWNVLVREVAGHWTCSAWLDWEYAWAGDPAWDLARLDLFRLKPIGPTPAAFFEGYGSAPKDPERTIYELSIYLWMANQYLEGEVDEERVLMPTYEAAMRYLDRVDEAVERIDRALEMPGWK